MFQPAVPLGGIAGFRVLEATRDTQQAAFDRSPLIERNALAFLERIGTITTAEELVADRQLLEVALGAFGLDEDINKTFFIRRMLEGGTDDPSSLANQFVDPRYRALSQAFGFGNISGPQTANQTFQREVVDQYRIRQFEIAVGNSDENLRLALNFKREIAGFANSSTADGAAWFSVMGSPPLRAVFEAAYNLPTEFGTLDVERQRDTLQERNREAFGDTSLAVFQDPEAVDTVITRFLARAQINAGPTASTPGVAALTLLQGAASFGSSQANLLLSNAVR